MKNYGRTSLMLITLLSAIIGWKLGGAITTALFLQYSTGDWTLKQVTLGYRLLIQHSYLFKIFFALNVWVFGICVLVVIDKILESRSKKGPKSKNKNKILV